MKITINENERGFLFKNGTFQRMLLPGKNTVYSIFGESYFKATVGKMVTIKDIDINVLLKDKTFADSVTKIDVPDLHFVLHYEDGKVIEALKTGTYYFWNV
ncbi:MAG: slipin family protein, partial [Clostridiales bacterium]|nr:slipin family protein [Clostridiales bacterium]